MFFRGAELVTSDDFQKKPRAGGRIAVPWFFVSFLSKKKEKKVFNLERSFLLKEKNQKFKASEKKLKIYGAL